MFRIQKYQVVTPGQGSGMSSREDGGLMGGKPNEMKRAELTAVIGASVLGGGVALFLDGALKPYALPILLLGFLVHGWGMYDKHRLESRSGSARLWWAEWLYWGCLVALLGLGLYVVLSGGLSPLFH